MDQLDNTDRNFPSSENSKIIVKYSENSIWAEAGGVGDGGNRSGICLEPSGVFRENPREGYRKSYLKLSEF